MALDRAAFIGNFVDETKENLRRIDDGVIRLKKDPENEEELSTVLRALHTIKGSSRMLKFNTMEQIAHGTENIFKGIREQRYTLETALMRLVLFGNDLLRKGIASILKNGDDAVNTSSFLLACEHAYANEPFMEDLEILKQETEKSPSVELVNSVEEVGKSEQKGTSQGTLPTTDGMEYESIRVKLSSVTRIIETLNSVIIKQFQFKQIQDDLAALEQSFLAFWTAARKHDLELRRKNDSSPMVDEFGQDFQKSIQKLRKKFIDQMAVLEQNSYGLQEQVMKLSMLPFDLILGELPRMVAETSASLGKEIDFSVNGANILMDKAILEKLNDPLLHLVRNSIDHGIESPTDREAAGKPKTGRISVFCSSEGGNIIIRITDDGKGIDYDKVKKRAIELGLLKETDTLNENEMFSYIFQSGFSTREQVSALSGRGIGLDIVKHNIDKIKGKISVKSSRGKGTEFILTVPLSLATVSGFFIMAGGEKFLIPSNFVRKIVRLSTSEKVSYYNKEGFKLDDQIIPLYSLVSLINRESSNKSMYQYIVVVESMGDSVGIIVDAVLQHADLIYKPVPRNIQRLKLIQGIVFDESYHIINILFVPELITRFKHMKSIERMTNIGKESERRKIALVVDDSMNTREIEKSILELEGFDVVSAVDGIDGLERLRENRFDIILSDIEMPRMDGITMIENIRKDVSHAGVPIVVVTSYSDSETARRIREAGADAQIVKGDFDRNSLLNIINHLIIDKQTVHI